MALTNQETIQVSDLIIKAIELQAATSDATLKEILAHVIAKLNGILWV